MSLIPSVEPGVASAFLSIALISLTMSGDNALVIGMAARGLPPRQRRLAIGPAILGAIVFRVAFAGLFAVLLFETELIAIRLVGGLALVWIAWKLVVDPPHGEDRDGAEDASGLLEAIGLVLLADVSMSIDNMLAVAAASNGRVWLIGVGLLVSIPLLFLGATVISRLLDRFPQLVWIGSGVIAYVAGELIVEEPLFDRWFHVPHLIGGIATPQLGGLVVLLSIVALAYVRMYRSGTPSDPAA